MAVSKFRVVSVPKEKSCSKCKEVKPASAFENRKDKTLGLSSACKVCILAARTPLDQKRIEARREWQRSRPPVQRKRKGTAPYVRKYIAANPIKRAAQVQIKKALESGAMTRGPCEVCAKPKGQAHHDDYAAPLKVRWLCAAHHKLWHRENGPGANG